MLADGVPVDLGQRRPWHVTSQKGEGVKLFARPDFAAHFGA